MKLMSWLDHFTAPLLVAVNLIGVPPNTWERFDAVLAGYITWVFAEHFIHRTVLHRWYRKEHWAHHLEPKSYDAAVPQWLVHLLLLVTYLASAGLLGMTYGLLYFAGLAIGYSTYIYTHNAIHWGLIDADSPWPLGGVARRHDLHHERGIEMNFNVLNPFADVVLGTFRQVPRGTK